MSVTINSASYGRYNDYNTQKLMQKLSSGKKINTAADDAAGLAISKKMIEQISRENKEIENYQDMQSMLKVSDGMYEGTSDYLMDMYEQGVRAQNSLLSDSDKEAVTDYMKALRDDAKAMMSTTKFNESEVASKEAIEALPQDFSLGSIDKAMNAVNRQRSKDGAGYNGYEHAINAKKVAAENLAAADSRLSDTEYGSAISQLKKNQTIETYRNMMQARQMRDAGDIASRLF